MLVEVARVLRYPRMKARYALTEEEIYEFVQFLRNVCDIVPIDQTLAVPMRDVNDLGVLRTAIIGEADVLYTLDSRLLRFGNARLHVGRPRGLY